MEALEEENEHAEAMLAKLKAAVGMIFDKYFSSEIDEQDAIRQVKDLGLEISVDVPTPRGRRCEARELCCMRLLRNAQHTVSEQHAWAASHAAACRAALTVSEC